MESNDRIERVKAELVNIDEETLKRVFEKLDEFNETRTSDKAYYAIGVTGNLRMYYTLWRVYDYLRAEQYNFIQNLSLNFEDAVNLAMKLTEHSNRPIEIENIQTLVHRRDANVIKFGKYANCLISDVYQQDPLYIVWLNKNYMSCNSKRDEFKLNIESYANMYFECLKKEHEKNPTSYIGELNKSVEKLKLSIYRIVKTKTDSIFKHGYVYTTTLYCSTEDNNKVILKFETDKFDIDFETHRNIMLGKGRVMKQYEYIGYKYTQVGYVKNVTVI